MYPHNLNTITFLANSATIDPEAPSLVLIHGAGQFALLWQHQVRDMATVDWPVTNASRIMCTG